MNDLDSWEKKHLDLEGRNMFERKAYKVSHYVLFTIFAILGTFIAWASWAELDQVTRGTGRIIPSSKTQIIQHFEGGIISDVLVKEGENVLPNQVLMRVVNVSAESELEDIIEKQLTLMAKRDRLKSEIEGSNEIIFDPDVLKKAPGQAKSEMALFVARKEKVKQENQVLQEQIKQKKQELVELSSRRKQLDKSFAIAKEEYDIIQPLVAQNLSPKLELIRIEEKMQDFESRLEALKLSVPRTITAIDEAESKLKGALASISSEANAELNDVEAQISTFSKEIEAKREQAFRTEIRSPVKGIINKIYKTTIGGVLRGGEDAIEIIPSEDTLLVQAKIKPKDRAALWIGLPAVVKVSAYNFVVHGGLKAKVINISPDTFTDEASGEAYYRVRLRTDKNTLGPDKPITPGMTADVAILSGKVTILEYFLKPLLRAREVALTERGR